MVGEISFNQRLSSCLSLNNEIGTFASYYFKKNNEQTCNWH